MTTTPTSPYPTLLSPITIRRTVVRNRVVITSHGASEAFRHPGAAPDTYIEYLRRRAAGGAGLIIAQPPFFTPTVPHTEETQRRHAALAAAVRAEGAVILLQLAHLGVFARSDADVHRPPLWGFSTTVTDQGDLTYLNLVHIPEIDGTDPNDLTLGEMRGRREAIYAVEALRKFMPGCEDAKLRNFGMTLGIRDTRKIDALYNLTGNDVREQARFDDAIGIFPEFIDGYGILILPTTGRYWHVPYRALVPKGVGNLLVAGRCIGGDKVSHASARNMMCCAVSGQGAGVAAAVSLQRDEPFDRLNIGAVQKELARQGARFR